MATNDDFVDNILGDKDFTEFLNDEEGGKNVVDGNAPLNEALEVYDSNNDLIGYECHGVVEKNPQLPAIPLTFYTDLLFPLGDEASAVRQVQLGLLTALASDYRISTGTACTDPPGNGSSWLVSILSEPDQLVRETTFPKCRELTVSDETQEECYVYELSLTVKSLTGTDIPDVEGVLGSLLANQVTALDSGYQTKFLGIPKFEDTQDDNTSNLNPPSNLNDSVTENNAPLNRSTITIVGGLLVAAFCMASVGILFVLWGRRKSQLRKQQEMLEQQEHQQNDAKPKQFSLDTEESDGDDDEEYNRPTTLDLSNSFNQQVFGAHAAASQRPHQHSRPKYLSNINASNQGPYSHFHNNGQSQLRRNNTDSDSDVDSWAQTDGTIGSLELPLEPITGEI